MKVTPQLSEKVPNTIMCRLPHGIIGYFVEPVEIGKEIEVMITGRSKAMLKKGVNAGRFPATVTLLAVDAEKHKRVAVNGFICKNDEKNAFARVTEHPPGGLKMRDVIIFRVPAYIAKQNAEVTEEAHSCVIWVSEAKHQPKRTAAAGYSEKRYVCVGLESVEDLVEVVSASRAVWAKAQEKWGTERAPAV